MPRVGKGVEQLELLHSSGRGYTLIRSLEKIVSQYILKLNVRIPSDTTIPFLSMHSKETHTTYVHQKICARMYTISTIPKLGTTQM